MRSHVEVATLVSRALVLADRHGFGAEAAELADRWDSYSQKLEFGRPVTQARKSVSAAWKKLQSKAMAAYRQEWRAAWQYDPKQERGLDVSWVQRGMGLYDSAEQAVRMARISIVARIKADTALELLDALRAAGPALRDPHALQAEIAEQIRRHKETTRGLRDAELARSSGADGGPVGGGVPGDGGGLAWLTGGGRRNWSMRAHWHLSPAAESPAGPPSTPAEHARLPHSSRLGRMQGDGPRPDFEGQG